MQIVIDIDEDLYKSIIAHRCKTRFQLRCDYVDLKNAIEDGTPLPKGHGGLIDRSKIYKAIPAEEDNCTGMGMTLEEMDAYNDGIDAMYMLVKGAKPIIEADNAESEVK